jgi:hypothetical protein
MERYDHIGGKIYKIKQCFKKLAGIIRQKTFAERVFFYKSLFLTHAFPLISIPSAISRVEQSLSGKD